MLKGGGKKEENERRKERKERKKAKGGNQGSRVKQRIDRIFTAKVYVIVITNKK